MPCYLVTYRAPDKISKPDARATGPVLTSVKEEKHGIIPTTLNFVVRVGKLRIYNLLNPLEIF